MNFIANHCFDLMFLCFLCKCAYDLWYHYIARINKFSDVELMERYVVLSKKGKIK